MAIWNTSNGYRTLLRSWNPSVWAITLVLSILRGPRTRKSAFYQPTGQRLWQPRRHMTQKTFFASWIFITVAWTRLMQPPDAAVRPVGAGK